MNDRIVILKTKVISEGDIVHNAAKIVAYGTISSVFSATHAVYFVRVWRGRYDTRIVPLADYKRRKRVVNDVYYVKDLVREAK